MNLEKSITPHATELAALDLLFPCRPRILIVTDGELNFRPDHKFGLWRFLQAITDVPQLKKPVLTLAHRGAHIAQITVGTDVHPVASSFKFDQFEPAVTLRNYDQIWLFGYVTGAFGLSKEEVGTISRFMNAGGGLFATGDHAQLGRQLCGDLPRVRRMREWSAVPMGFEDDTTIAVQRIDTIVSPGPNSLYEFSDQSDDIPQRIYPNYRVVDTGNFLWEAFVHPTLLLPGATEKRTTDAGFSNDVDVFPDHAHESVCRDVTKLETLALQYIVHGQDFPEWQPSASNPQQRVGATIVAYAVSAGRAVDVGAPWNLKPPVRPQMFAILSAYDGRTAQPYGDNTQPPGRILCDSTWHHYVNINVDGTGSGRTGLGTGVGPAFVPNAALLKIYTFYRNATQWLQPANRVWCPIISSFLAVRYSPELIEELSEPETFTEWGSLVVLGRAAAGLIARTDGAQAVSEWIPAILRSDRKTRAAGELLADPESTGLTGIERDELLHGIAGGLLVKLSTMLPSGDHDATEATLGKGMEKLVRDLQPELPRLLARGAQSRIERAQRTLQAFEREAFRVK